MGKQSICFIAQFPPPIHGLSKAVETLYDSMLADGFLLEKVNITKNIDFLKNLRLIAKSKARVFYFTISQTRGGNMRDLVILKLLQKQNKKCIVHLHGGYYRQLVDQELPVWQKNANYAAIGKLDGAIVLGNSFRPVFGKMLPEHKIFVVPNCIDDEYLMPDEAFEEKLKHMKDGKVKHVIYLSNLIRTKGYLEALELALREKKRCSFEGDRKLHFDFAGAFFDKAERNAFFHFIEENSLEGYVTYHGVVTGKEKENLLRDCEIFVLLTRYPNEGQPISILEAMGNGMLVVTTNHAGIPDLVQDGVNGIVMDKDALDMDRCYRKILEAMDQSNTLRPILKNNREVVKQSYSQKVYIDKMEKILQSV